MQTSFISDNQHIRIECIESGPATEKSPALLILHGAGGNSAFWFDRLAPFAAESGLALYAPHYFDRTGTVRADYDAVTDGVHVPQWLDTIDDALHWIEQRPGVDPKRIGVVGVSLGAFLSLALAAQLSASHKPEERERIRCLIDVSGGLVEPYASQATRYFPPTLLLHGEADTVVSPEQARSLDARLSALAVPHETRLLPSEGHWFSSGAQFQLLLAASNFLGKQLAPAAALAR